MSSQTNFQSVMEFMRTAGQDTPATLQKDVLVQNPKLTNFRLDLIREEVRELEEAARDNNMTEVIDALGDILYVVYGMGAAFGIDLDKAFSIVHASNMSKFCRTEQEAMESVEHYKTLKGFEDVNVGYKYSPDSKCYVLYNVATGKVLKSKYFKLPDFKEMMA